MDWGLMTLIPTENGNRYIAILDKTPTVQTAIKSVAHPGRLFHSI
jgi:hypothetical protein